MPGFSSVAPGAVRGAARGAGLLWVGVPEPLGPEMSIGVQEPTRSQGRATGAGGAAPPIRRRGGGGPSVAADAGEGPPPPPTGSARAESFHCVAGVQPALNELKPAGRVRRAWFWIPSAALSCGVGSRRPAGTERAPEEKNEPTRRLILPPLQRTAWRPPLSGGGAGSIPPARGSSGHSQLRPGPLRRGRDYCSGPRGVSRRSEPADGRPRARSRIPSTALTCGRPSRPRPPTERPGRESSRHSARPAAGRPAGRRRARAARRRARRARRRRTSARARP